MSTAARLVTDEEAEVARRKRADLAGPGIGTYEEVDRALPDGYRSALTPRQTQVAIYEAKRVMEEGLCRELGLMMVQVPLIVGSDTGVNDMLDRDGSRTPIGFHIANDRDEHPIDAEVVQAATKWKRLALRQFDMGVGEGLCTDMRAVRKDYFLDHDHSAYVDQWDWERAIAASERNLDFLRDVVRRIWRVIKQAEARVHELFPALAADHPDLPQDVEFMHAEEILEHFPGLPRKERETRILQEHPALFIIGIGWTLADGYPHEMRAADYDDWSTEVTMPDGRPAHGLNGDLLVWNPVTRRRHELSSMGIRVDAAALRRQLEITGQLDWLSLPYHRAITEGTVPLSIGGGIGQSRTQMLLLRKAHLGEVSVTVWPQILKEISARHNVFVLE
jgi:aspartate--ammonia ligase